MKKTLIKLTLVCSIAFMGFTQIPAPAVALAPLCTEQFCTSSPYCKCWDGALYICHRWMGDANP